MYVLRGLAGNTVGLNNLHRTGKLIHIIVHCVRMGTVRGTEHQLVRPHT